MPFGPTLRTKAVRGWAISLLALLDAGSASAIDSVWSGGAAGNWNVAGNWTPSGVPNNGVNLYNVQIPSPAAVQVNGTFSIQAFDLDPGASAAIQPGQMLTLNANGVVDGTLRLGAAGNFNASRLRLGTDLTLAGAGTAELRGVTVFDSPAGGRLTIGAGLTVRSLSADAGFELVLTNHGNLLFEGNRGVLNLPDGQFINTGTFGASLGARVEISAINNATAIINSGTLDLNGAELIFNFLVDVTNTGTFLVRNGGTFRGSNTFTNTGGRLRLETLGTLVPSTLTIVGGSVEGPGGMIDMTDFNAQSLTLQSGPGGDTLELSVPVRMGPGRDLVLVGDLEFTGVSIDNQTGGNVKISGNVDIAGTATLPFQLRGAAANDTLTLGGGITLTTGTVADSLTVKTVNTAGPIEIRSPDAVLAAASTLSSTGPVHLFNNAILNTIDANLVLQNNVVQLDTGSRISGGVMLNGTTINGAGSIRTRVLAVAGTSIVNTPVETGSTTITATGAAVINGVGELLVNQGSFTTMLNAAALGATLTTGPDFDIAVSSGHTLTANLPWRLQSDASIAGGTLVIAADLENDGAIDLTGPARMNVNKNIIAGSTGSVSAGANAIVTVNGASMLAGSFGGAGNYTFAGVTPVSVAGFAATGTLTLNSGANVRFTEPVTNVTSLVVNSNNASVAFDGGLQSFGTATVNGSGGVFGVTGNATATGLFRVQNGATHRGTGTTTAQGALEFDGKLDGRTLIAQGTTTAEQVTLQNNAVFVNQGAFSFFNFGPPAAITGTGIFRNNATLTQPNDGAVNTISSNFEQTPTGTLVPVTGILLTGNSTIAGSITVPENGTVSFGAGLTETTHTVSGTIAGGGKVEAKGSVTGVRTHVTVTGDVELTGENSGITVGSGATVSVQLPDANLIGLGPVPNDVQVIKISGLNFSAELQILALVTDLFDLREIFMEDEAELKGDPPPPATQQAVSAQTARFDAADTKTCTLQKIHFRVDQDCSTRGLLDLIDSTLEIGPACTWDCDDRTRLTAGAGDGTLIINGGTWVIPEFAEVEIDAPVAVVFDDDGNVIVRHGAEIVVNGQVVSSTTGIGTWNIAADAAATFNGPARLVDTSIVAEAGSGASVGGTCTISEALELRDCSFEANARATIEITLAPTANRADVETVDAVLDDAFLVGYTGFFTANATVGFSGKGAVHLSRLQPTTATATFGADNAAGRLVATGNLPLGPGSIITPEIGGTTQITQHDLLAVTGVLDASATSLQPVFINNFQTSVTATNTFTVIETTQPIVGTFANVVNGRVSIAGNAGSFSVTFTQNRTRVVLGDFTSTVVVDTDGDGMPDAFEQQYFGSPTAGDPAADQDGDGMNNLNEFRTGTSPLDPLSVFRITAIRRQGNDIEILFLAAPDKSYEVVASPTLDGAFTIPVATVPATPTGGLRTVTDPGAAFEESRFYEIVHNFRL